MTPTPIPVQSSTECHQPLKIHYAHTLTRSYPGRGRGGSETYPGDPGCEVGIHPDCQSTRVKLLESKIINISLGFRSLPVPNAQETMVSKRASIYYSNSKHRSTFTC